MVSVRVERKRRCWESRRGWRVASSGNKSEREGEGEGKKKKNKKTSTSFLSTSRVYRVYPLEQRPGNLIPFSIYLNPLTQTRSSSTSGPPSFHSLSRPSLTLPLFPQVPPLFRLVSSNPPSRWLPSYSESPSEKRRIPSSSFSNLFSLLSNSFHLPPRFTTEVSFLSSFFSRQSWIRASKEQSRQGERGRRKIRRRREGECIQ